MSPVASGGRPTSESVTCCVVEGLKYVFTASHVPLLVPLALASQVLFAPPGVVARVNEPVTPSALALNVDDARSFTTPAFGETIVTLQAPAVVVQVWSAAVRLSLLALV